MCTFSVTVEAIPVLGATRFVAFGDSITEGKLATGEPPPVPYPADVMARLTARYTTQQFTVQNAGNGAETTSGGVGRLPGVLSATNAEALLLLEGVNDLAPGDASAISVVINNLRTMIQQARSRGVAVFLGTLLPEIPGGSRTGARLLIVPTNDQIRALAASQGVTLVDVYQAFSGMETVLIGGDGLHPTVAGYSMIAQTFFDAIRAKLEVTPTTTLTLSNGPAVPFALRVAR